MDNIKSFFDYFSADELLVVQNDLKKHYNGFKFLYVIDTYDIINYTLPFTNFDFTSAKQLRNSKSIIFYEYIFNNPAKFCFILADEYKEELSNIIDYYNRNIRDFPIYRDRLLKSLIRDLNNADKYGKKKSLNNLETFIIFYIFFKDGNNLLKRFKSFTSKYLNVDYLSTPDEYLNEITLSAFKSSERSSLTNQIFDEFVERQKYKLSSLESDFERYCYLDNTYRDISVVDRIYQINQNLKYNDIEVHYLSSAPSKTNQIFNSLRTLDISLQECQFNRNIGQLFLFDHLTENSSSLEEAISSIDFILETKDMDTIFKKVSVSIDGSFNKVVLSAYQSFESQKQLVEQTYFFDSFFHYQSLFNESIKNQNITSDLQEFIDVLHEINFNNIRELEIQNKIAPKSNLNQIINLTRNLQNINSTDGSLMIKGGLDIIKNTFHHLPYLLLLKTKQDKALLNFHELLDTISNYSHIIGYKSKRFREELDETLSYLSIKKLSFEKLTQDYLLLIFLNIITSKHNEDEKNLITNLESQINLIKKSSLKKEYTENRLEIDFKNKDIILEFEYLLMWLYRRNKMYNNCIELFQNSDYSSDPRMIHGLSLTYHSMAYEINNQGSLDHIENSKIYIEQAIDRYREINGNEFQENTIKKQFVGLLNNLIDTELYKLRYSIIKIEEADLEECRINLSVIKSIIKALKPEIPYDSLETINHTETELEYYEALKSFNNGDYSQCLQKLNFTTKRIDIIKNSQYLVSEHFKKIKESINSLRYQVMKKLRIIRSSR